MKLTTILFVACVLVGAGTLGASYVLSGWTAGGLAALAIAGLWLAGHLLGRWPNANLLAWVLFMLATAFGALIGLQPALILVAAVAAICGWDLGAFEMRIHSMSRIDDLRQLEGRHVDRLAIVAAGGLALGGLALFGRVEFDFGAAVLLAGLAALLLGLAIRLIVHSRPAGR
jgi:hypothetical protein